MQDRGNKSGRSPSSPSHLRVVGYDEVPLDKAERLSESIEGDTAPNNAPLSQGNARTGNTIPWIGPKEKQLLSSTLPYSPLMTDSRPTQVPSAPSPAVSGIRMGNLDPAELRETEDNAARMSDEITRVVRPPQQREAPAPLLDLPTHFDDLEVDKWVDQSHAFRGLGPGCGPISQRIAQQVKPLVESGDSPEATPEISYEGPDGVLPPTPESESATKPERPAGRPAIAPPSATREQRKAAYPTKPLVYERPATPVAEKADAQLKTVTLPVQPLAPSNLPASVSSQRRSATESATVAQTRLQPAKVQAPLKTVSETPVEKTVDAPQEKRKSLWGRMTSKVGSKLSAAKEAVTGFVKKHKTGVVVATSLAAAASAGVYAHQTKSTNSQNNTDNSYQTVDTPPTTPTTSATETKAPVEAPEVVVAPVQDQVEKTPTPRKFSKVLKESKSPLVQDIIQNGKTTLNGSILGNTMLMPFKGLGTNAEQAEINKLQRSINLGMGVFFNEHFGTPEKIAQSLKDPNLRSLYSTAKVMKEKGWAPASLTKDKYPTEYQLAAKIFADSSALSLDKTDNPDPKVQARVNGNMFQAKHNGDSLQLQKADGSYHVVLEAVFNILDGQNAEQAILAASASNSLQPARSPVQHEQINEIGPDAPQDSISIPPSAPSHTLNQLNPATPAILQNNYSEKPQNALASTSTSQDSLDSEWEEIGKAMDQLAAEKAVFEKDLSLPVAVKAGLGSRELHRELITAVGEKLAMLYPLADSEQVIGMVKRFGFIGFRLENADPASGQCQVKVYKNVHKIMKEVLDKRVGHRQNRSA